MPAPGAIGRTNDKPSVRRVFRNEVGGALGTGSRDQIRNVPEALHRRPKSRAALEGMSLSDYVLAELRRVAERPSLAELRERLGAPGSMVAGAGRCRLAEGIAFSPDGNYLYVGNFVDGDVDVLRLDGIR